MSEERAVYRIDHQRPTPLPVTTPEPPKDAGRWLVVTMIELSKRFLSMARGAGFTEARERHECPKCGWRD